MRVTETSGVPIKAWTDGVLVEDKAMQQARNIAGLPFIHKHVALMPDCHWGMGATVGSVIATTGAVVPAAVGVDIGCFVGETIVPLLDGTQRSLAELVGRDPFWVYSVGADGRIVPGKAVAILTRRAAELVEVEVSGGARIVCTPDHEFMLRDGSFLRAAELVFNQSLMPLYRRYETRDGYESVLHPSGGSEATHIAVAKWKHGPADGRIAHHKDHNHFNNTPENLEYLTASEHSKLHRRMDGAKSFRVPGFQERRLAALRERGFYSDAAKKAADSTANLKAGEAAHPEAFAKNYEAAGRRGAPTLARVNVSPKECGYCDAVLPNLSAYRWHVQKEHRNHKVVAVRPIDRKADVYCLRVDDHHNFALACGVFVHNCGMVALRLTLNASQLPDSLYAIRSAIEAAIPHGRTDNGGANDRGSWGNPPDASRYAWNQLIKSKPTTIHGHDKAMPKRDPVSHLGTLGTGNHFIELCLDETDQVWIMLHSGSRGLGNRIGSYFIELAKEDMRRWFINLPDADLAYLPEGTNHFDDYVEAVGWAQKYATWNRELMLCSVVNVLHNSGLPEFESAEAAINCHHNYVEREHHFGKNVLVTRKGAVRAREGDLGIIPGSMGAKSYIVRGKGNAMSFNSCSHGAGRAMSRTEAKRRFSLDDHAKATAGVECRKDSDVIDETPAAYKDIDAVMEAQKDLVDVVHILKQVLCVKG